MRAVAVDDDAAVLVVLVERLHGVALVVDRHARSVAAIDVYEFLHAVLGALLRVAHVQASVTRALVGIAHNLHLGVGVALHEVGHLLHLALAHLGIALADDVEDFLVQLLLHGDHLRLGLLLDHGLGNGLRFGFNHGNGFGHHYGFGLLLAALLVLVTEAEAHAEHGGEHPVVGIVHLRVEAVAQAVGIHFQRQSEGLRHVGLQTQSGAHVVRQAVLIPSQIGVQVLMLGGDDLQLVVVPRIVQAEATHEDDVQRVLRRLREEVGEVHEQVGIGGHVVPLVVLVELVESALGLPGIGVQAQTHRGEEVVAEGKTHGRGEQLVDGSIGRRELQATLCLYERPRFQFALALLGIGGGKRKHCHGDDCQ